MPARLLALVLAGALAALAGLAGPAGALAAPVSHRHAHTKAHAIRRSGPGAGVSGTLFIRGGGYGHGIGLSQYGSLGLAEHGADYRTILAHYYSGTALGVVSPGTTVRVLLARGRAAFSGIAEIGHTKLDPNLTYAVKALHDGTLAIVGPNHRQVGPRWLSPLGVGTTGGTVSAAGLGLYRGGLEFRPDGSGGVQTVDVLGLEDYLRGVVAAESPSSWPAAALEAQAVAARTYALTTSVTGNGYTLYADTRSQMYGGVGAETPETDAAIAATSGQVVTYGGQPVVTYFSSSSGGYTASIQDVWTNASPEPWLKAVPDPYDDAGANPHHAWTYSFTLAAASARLGSALKGTLLGIRVVRRGDSPRVLLADVVGTRGTTQVSGATLQADFGLPTTLASFTTITTQSRTVRAPGAAVPAHGPATGGAGLDLRAAWLPARLAVEAMGAPLVAARDATGQVVHRLAGAVSPASAGQRLTIQLRVGHAWWTVATVRAGDGGAYSARVPLAGTYRVTWQHLAGPAVAVG